MSERLDQDEELLERLLAELGGAEPGDGFAGRVLRGVDGRRSARGMVWGWPLGLATAGLVLAIAGGLVVERSRHGVVVERKADLSAALRDGKNLGVRDGKRLGARDGRRLGVRNGDTVGLVAGSSVRRAVELMRASVAEPVMEDVSRVASFPAPELPLTEQERLLQRAVNRGNPLEIAMLRPEERELQAKLERAEFEAFFPKPDPPLNDVANPGEGVGPKGLAGVDAAGPNAADRSLGQQNSLDKGNQGEKQ